MGAKPKKRKKWKALDHYCGHDNMHWQEATQKNEMVQRSHESIIIKDSCDIDVTTTDTKVAVSLQAALQVAIVIVVSITIADGDLADKVTHELLQQSAIKQSNTQALVIENSRGVNVVTTDTDIAVSIQVLIQILLALLAQLDIL